MIIRERQHTIVAAVPPISQNVVRTMRRAMLPLDGSIAEYIPGIVAAYADLVPPHEWSSVTVVDLTAGSCLLPLLFAARGVGRLVVNDIAARSYLAAAALFGGHRLDARRVRKLASTPSPRLKPHTPTFHFASDFLTADVADTFDRLFYARLLLAERPVYRYLALRWVLGFVPSPEEEFAILPTHDYGQLRQDCEHDWSRYIRRVRIKASVLDALVGDINAAINLVMTRRVELRQADMLMLCREVDYGRRAFVIVNPPTRGIDEYVIDDQLAHSLLANRWLPLSRSRETAEDFWTRRVEAALCRVPPGSHALVWGGDGVLTFAQSLRIWTRYGDPVVVRRIGRGRHAPGWMILRIR